MLSIKVSILSDNLVGNVIFGKKLFVVIISKYSLNIGFSFILSTSILKSPVMITSPLYLLKLFRMGVSSVMN